MLLSLLELWILAYVSIEVRHCGTALPHHRTAVFGESFVVARGARNMVPRPKSTAAQAGVSGDAAQRRGQPAGAACAGCRVVSVQRATRIVSQKLVAYFSTPIPSCPGRSGARSLGEGTASAPVACGRSAAALSAHFCRSIDFRAPIYPRFMTVYADLFYTKLLNLLELCEFG